MAMVDDIHRGRLRWLRPTLAGMLLWPLVLFFELALSSASLYTSMGQEVIHSFGPGPVLEIREMEAPGQPPASSVRWSLPWLIAALTAPYMIASAWARFLARGWPRPARFVATLVLCIVVLSLFSALIGSRWYWGYWFSRPRPDTRLLAARSVSALSLVETPSPAGRYAPLRLHPATTPTLAEELEFERRDPYSFPESRVLSRWSESGLLNSARPAVDPGRLSATAAAADSAGIFLPGSPGYDGARGYRGVMAEIEGPDGDPLVFLGISSGEISNDHHPYYEFLLRGGPGGMQVLAAQRFFYDVAGVEGLEWRQAWLALIFVGLVLAAPLSIAWTGVRLIRSRREGDPVLTAAG